jgi:pre-mRNA-splicing factor CWC26
MSGRDVRFSRIGESPQGTSEHRNNADVSSDWMALRPLPARDKDISTSKISALDLDNLVHPTTSSPRKMSLSSYLASKYLNAEPSSSGKKRKRKEKSSTSGLIIADDDALGWSTTQGTKDDDDTPTTVVSGSAEFRKAKKNAWKTVGVPALQPKDNEADEADRIISEAAAENSAAMHEDEGPVIEAAQWEREQRALGKGKEKKVEETVYRDATGRRIDLSMRRQEARKEADEKARKEREEKEMQKGDVQRLEKEKRREELDEARFMPLARKIDDVEMNDELKEQDRWNDPAAQFLTKKSKGKSASGKPLYKGAAAPNRYGIRPGHRWDGVDRGNGWEGERFKALNRTARNKELDYSWQMDE